MTTQLGLIGWTCIFSQVSSIKRAGTLPHLRGSQKRLEQAALELENEETSQALSVGQSQSKTLTRVNPGSVSARDLVHPSINRSSTRLEPLHLEDGDSAGAVVGSHADTIAGSAMPPPQARYGKGGKGKGKARGIKGKRKAKGVVGSQSARGTTTLGGSGSSGSGSGMIAQRPAAPPSGLSQKKNASTAPANRARKLVGTGRNGDSTASLSSTKQGGGRSSSKSKVRANSPPAAAASSSINTANKQLLFQNGMKIDGFFVTMSVYGVATGLELVVYEPNSAQT